MVDGDVVVTLPFSALAYRHVGCLVIIDAEGLGSIIIDPSDVEKKLRTKSKAYINNHQLIFYKNGLEGVLRRATMVLSESVKSSASAAKDSSTSDRSPVGDDDNAYEDDDDSSATQTQSSRYTEEFSYDSDG